MLYITGIHALNIECELDTTGDWHTSALSWDAIKLKDSKGSIFGDWGIEQGKIIPEHIEKYNVANHIRAILDLLDEGNFAIAGGMRKDYICNEDYTELIMELAYKLNKNENWEQIDAFMEKEYKLDWVLFRRRAEDD